MEQEYAEWREKFYIDAGSPALAKENTRQACGLPGRLSGAPRDLLGGVEGNPGGEVPGVKVRFCRGSDL